MGTYEKQYFVKKLTFIPENKTIEAIYGVMIKLDNGQVGNLDDLYSVISGSKFDELFNIEITALGKLTSLGEFITYLTSSAATLKDTNFPIAQEQSDKFGNSGIALFQAT